MGCSWSRTHDRAAAYRVKEGKHIGKAANRQPYSWERADRPDPADFQFSKLTGQTCVKLPGSISGQQFIIADCEDCTFWLLDHSAAVSIDDCTNCKIYVGPVESRTRDCSDCEFMLFCRTKPIIESSSGLGIGCHNFAYAGLAGQLDAVHLSPFQNFWSRVHDFTPAPGNWHLLPEDRDAIALLGGLPQEAAELQAGSGQGCLPVTRGNRPRGDLIWCWVLFPKADRRQQLSWLHSLPPEVTLLHANEAQLDAAAAGALASKAGQDERYAKQLHKGPCIGLELGCQGSTAAVQQLAEESGALFSLSAAAAEQFESHGIDG